MKDAEKVAKKSEQIEEEIMGLIEKLKTERVKSDQADGEYLAGRIAGAMWRKVHTWQPVNGLLEFHSNALVLNELLLTFSAF